MIKEIFYYGLDPNFKHKDEFFNYKIKRMLPGIDFIWTQDFVIAIDDNIRIMINKTKFTNEEILTLVKQLARHFGYSEEINNKINLFILEQ